MSAPPTATATPPLDELLEAFALPNEAASVRPHGSGRIHASFRLDTAAGRFLLQRVNERVFADVDALGDNLSRITGHLATLHGADPRRHLALRPTATGAGYHRARADGACWRMFGFIDGAGAAPSPPDESSVHAAARLFGRFLHDMASLPGPPPAVTIPHFHDTAQRYRAFEAALADDPLGRAVAAGEAVAFARERRPLAAIADELHALGSLPVRVVHNDCKLDNVLFDERSGEALCVVDLDTVMPGLVLYDIGDFVRSAAASAGEEAGEGGVPEVDLARYEAILHGYLEGAAGLLVGVEMAHLASAGRVVAYELGLRFLADHLLGDRYFAAAAPDDNLLRARRQFALVESMERRAREMTAIARALTG